MAVKYILYIILSATTTSGIIVYLIKKSYDKRLSRKLAENQEDIRRQGNIFNEQYDAFKLMVSLIYRSKNKAKDIIEVLEGKPIDHNAIEDKRRGLRSYNDALSEILYDQRLIIPKAIFEKAHNTKNDAYKLEKTLSDIRLKLIGNNVECLDELIGEYKTNNEKLIGDYKEIVNLLQHKMEII